ncbi:MAG: hypothetical protein QW566_03805 [Candidatus Jordarchaeales archaeon]
MKVARFMPAFVKDVNVYLKLIREVFSKHGYFKQLLLPSLDYLTYRLVFDSSGMSDEQVIDNVLKRTEAVIEFKKRFREWLAREERRDYWEGTAVPQAKKLIEVHKWKHMLKWPIKLENPKMEKRYTYQAKWEALYYSAGVYDLDGNRLRPALKSEKGIRFFKWEEKPGNIIKIDDEEIQRDELFKRDDLTIAQNKRAR